MHMHLIICSSQGREEATFPSHSWFQSRICTCIRHRREMPACRYGTELSQGEAGAALSCKWACERAAIYLNNIPLPLVFCPSLFWILLVTMGKSFRPPRMQMKHARAARGISSKLEDFLKVGMNQVSVFFQAAWKKNMIWSRPSLCNSNQTSADTV